MRSITSDGGAAERDLRAALWRAGLRFRKHDVTLIGKPDLVFRRAKVAVFVDSGFWHGQLSDDALDRMSSYWREKLRRNRARDEAVTQSLVESGWLVLRFAEDDVLRDCDSLVRSIAAVVRQRAQRPRRAQSQVGSPLPREAARHSQ
jgi:DNA mismatch endonuclease (patch repair protein)